MLGLVQLPQIQAISPTVAAYISKNQYLLIFVTSILGPLMISVLNSIILPLVLRLITRLQGWFYIKTGVKTQSGVERSVLYKYFAFLIYQYISFLGLQAIISILQKNINNTADSQRVKVPLSIQILRLISSNLNSLSTSFVILAAQSLSGSAVEIAQAFVFFTPRLSRSYSIL